MLLHSILPNKSAIKRAIYKYSKLIYPKSFRTVCSGVTRFAFPTLPTNWPFTSYWTIVSWRPLQAWQTYLPLKQRAPYSTNIHC